MTLDLKNKHILIAKEAAEKYCNDNFLSANKLNSLWCVPCYDECVVFFKEYEGPTKGLKDDMKTMPLKVLIYDIQKKKIIPTEYTRKYLL